MKRSRDYMVTGLISFYDVFHSCSHCWFKFLLSTTSVHCPSSSSSSTNRPLSSLLKLVCACFKLPVVWVLKKISLLYNSLNICVNLFVFLAPGTSWIHGIIKGLCGSFALVTSQLRHCRAQFFHLCLPLSSIALFTHELWTMPLKSGPGVVRHVLTWRNNPLGCGKGWKSVFCSQHTVTLSYFK